MKKLPIVLVIALVAIYAVGQIQLGEAGALRFLTQMDSMMTNGKGREICELFHDELEVDITDRTDAAIQHITGGKQEFCEITTVAAASLNVLPHTMSVDFTELESKADWLHPWTREVSYLENRSLGIRDANVTIRTVSRDKITLVLTLSGVKLRKLRSEVFKADAT